MTDIRTPKERERDERNARIRSEYLKLKNENRGAADYRIFLALGRQYRLSWQSIRNIVINPVR